MNKTSMPKTIAALASWQPISGMKDAEIGQQQAQAAMIHDLLRSTRGHTIETRSSRAAANETDEPKPPAQNSVSHCAWRGYHEVNRMMIEIFMYGIFFALVLLAVANRVLIFKSKRNPNFTKARIIVGKINTYVGWLIVAFLVASMISLLNTLSRYGMI